MDFVKWARIHWDRVLAVVCAVAGAVVLILGWNGASQTAFPAEQLPYLLSGGLLGLLLFGAGATLWLSADLRDEWGELRGIRDELHQLRRDGETSGRALHDGSVTAVVAAEVVLDGEGNGKGNGKGRPIRKDTGTPARRSVVHPPQG